MNFSIIVPAYNSAPFLDTCISSVKAQCFTDWELIVVNDGSTDNTCDILRRYAESDERIRVIEQENRGQFFARQKGISVAKGQYVVFLDSDDALPPHCLSRLQAEIRNGNWDIIFYTGVITVKGEETRRTIGYIASDRFIVTPEYVKEKLIASNELNSLCTKAFRRDLFSYDSTDYSSFEGLRCGEDKAQVLYPITNAKSILYIPDCLYLYNYREDSTVHRFEISDISRPLANEMFSLLRSYMEMWDMCDQRHMELLALYRIRTFLSVYFGFRKRCTTPQERHAFRCYPWHSYISADGYRSLKRKLSIKEKIKLFVAEKGL